MKQGNGVKLGITLWVVVSLYGCATTREVQIVGEDTKRLDSRISQIQREQNSLKKEIESIRKDLTAFQKETVANHASLQAEGQKIRADLLVRIESLHTEMRALSTGVEEHKEFLKTPAKEMARMREDVEVRLRVLEERSRFLEEQNRSLEEKKRALEEKNRSYDGWVKAMEERLKAMDVKMTSKLAELEKTIPAKEPPVELKTTAANLYKDAYETFQRGDLDPARRKFEAFLKQFPNMDLSDNAQFWIGETYYLKKDYEKAILEYEKVMVKYPEGDKVSAALLKQGFAFLELGDQTNGRNLLRRVMERYPKTEQADIAKKKLETIK